MRARTAPLWAIMRPTPSIAVALLCVTALIGCEASGRARLEALPEASLMLPGSEELADGGSERAQGIEGVTQATTWVILGTDSSVEDVLAFYETELAEDGWVQYPMARTTSEIEAHAWRRDEARSRIRLSFKETEEWYLRIEGSDRFATLYELRLIESPSQP